MTYTIATSTDLIDGLVRTCFGVEPDAMAALARDDAQVLLRQAPGEVQEPTELDGVEAFLRRTVAISLAMRGRIDPVRLLTERQARAGGWPCARLANMAVVLGWALVLSDGPIASIPVLLEADEAAEDLDTSFGGDELPALDDLLDRFYKPIDSGAVSRLDGGCREAPSRDCRHVRLGVLVEAWFGVDVLATTLRADEYAPRLVSSNARAVAFLVWVITEGLELGAAMRSEMIDAARIKTEADARVAGEPGAVAANAVLLLACAIRHGAGWTPHLLAPREHAAAELFEHTRQVRLERPEADGDGEARIVALFALRDHAARHHIHVGRLNVQHVARRLYHRCTRPMDPGPTPVADGSGR